MTGGPRRHPAGALGDWPTRSWKRPDAYQTQLGRWFKDGRELSGGQWQKIVIFCTEPKKPTGHATHRGMASTSTLDANPAWFGPPHDRAEPLSYAAMDDTALRQRIDELYREHRAAIARHIRALTQDSASTDDLVNETFLRAYRALRSFEDRSSISTWLHGIAVNVTRTHLDKHRRRDRLDLRLAEQQAELAAPGPERQAEARRSIERFRQLVVELPTPLREAYVMRVIEQQSWHDVSTALGVPISTLHGRVSRAEAQIKAAWEEGS